MLKMKCHKRKVTCYSVSTQRANLPKHKTLVPAATPKLVQQVGVSSKAGELLTQDDIFIISVPTYFIGLL